MTAELYIGLMSGTSLDGVDGVIADLADSPRAVLRHRHLPFPDDLRADLLALNSAGADELPRAWLAGNGLARCYAKLVATLLEDLGAPADDIIAIGVHGQTVRHRPGVVDGVGYTIQLNNPALLAELTGIDVIADFRSRDVAAGGQGAPLAPAFHRSWFGKPGQRCAVLNIGGISNLTLLSEGDRTIGFDCGPGNALMDDWCLRHQGQPFDDAGRWAASGTVIDSLLQSLLAEPYLALPPPKSTGRDLFNPKWIAPLLNAGWAPVDVQATLAEFTARSITNDLKRHGADIDRLVVCGGGAYNSHLLARLGALLPGVEVQTSDAHGLPATQVEATAFAWLAQRFVRREPGNLSTVTGARGERLLGALYPA